MTLEEAAHCLFLRMVISVACVTNSNTQTLSTVGQLLMALSFTIYFLWVLQPLALNRKLSTKRSVEVEVYLVSHKSSPAQRPWNKKYAADIQNEMLIDQSKATLNMKTLVGKNILLLDLEI